VSRQAQLALSLAVSGLALWYSLRGVDLGAVGHALAQAKILWTVPMGAVIALALWLRAARWRVLLETVVEADALPIFSATAIGFMGNMVLPLRAGEAIRPLIVARSGGVTFPAAIATVAIDRVMDLIMLGVFGILTLLVVPKSDRLEAATQGIAVTIAVGVVGLVLVIRASGWIEARVPAFLRFLPGHFAEPVGQAIVGFLRGLRGLRDLRVLAAALFYSALIWLTSVLCFAGAALALDIQIPLLASGIAATVIVAAAVTVPSAPGFIGVFQAGSVMALELFQVPEAIGFSFGMLTWLVQMVVIVGLGLICLSRMHLSLGEIARESAAASVD
jgi:glycosyltransferase 2 family protein